ncbi:NAD-dependent epimerase/dehydratase family protein [Chelatococcus reniformis]|uniref:Nucleoside-diphosphate-sugar epimerase n=1 Tax=Chelatococcus reniformis TaxID=1494448 RepID=A0A916XKY6_9HYPH|nr:SDR family NAD(P)-dependent oxidoreductase [Chelatococcus reniformis]GGC78588.1 nucleoside-diphosphate-sugar epimerase [Chelatococcus reniformis]
MMETVLITGGAGFIGRHLAQALLQRGYRVRMLDSLIEQVHQGRAAPAQLPAEVEFQQGDVRDGNAVGRALRGADALIHLAAEVGVGQSMYAIDRYVAVNDLGTAVVFQQLIERPVRRVVVASSMSIYGEGLYRTVDGEPVEDAERTATVSTTWDPVDEQGRPLQPVPTPEWKRPALASVYALTKYVQERLTLNICGAYGMQGVALRLFNVYGPGQALSNPYTGVLAIFASRLLNGKAPLVFEDGRQRRDFVHVSDVARAFIAALEHPAAPGGVFNVGSGHELSIAEVARSLASAMGRDTAAEVTGKARTGDIRHCFADIGKAERELGFRPVMNFEAGLAELAQWVAQQEAVDRADDARRELELRGLVA